MGVKGFNVMSIGRTNLFDPKDVGYEDSIDIISEELHKTKKSFIKVGWYLKHIDEKKMYEQEGYDNIVDFSKDKFNLSQPTTNRFIRLCEEFSINHNSPELDEKYANFSVSQLIEMVSMKPEQLEQVSEEMTVREIKEIKKPSKIAIAAFYNLFIAGTEYGNKRNGLKEYLIEKFGRTGCGGSRVGFTYSCSRRGISINDSSEITWTNLVKEINEMFPVVESSVNEDDNIPGQTSIENDFPEYLPKEQEVYATSHKDMIETEEQEYKKSVLYESNDTDDAQQTNIILENKVSNEEATVVTDIINDQVIVEGDFREIETEEKQHETEAGFYYGPVEGKSIFFSKSELKNMYEFYNHWDDKLSSEDEEFYTKWQTLICSPFEKIWKALEGEGKN